MTKTDTPKDHLADKSYKRLFSHPQMVEYLLRDFVKPDWISQVDFTTLEKVNASYVTDDYRDRSDDLVWKVQWRQETVLYIYLLLEFQSTVDPFMAVRIMVYLGLLYQDLIKTKQLTKDRQLPPVLPIVLYHGQADSWNAKRDIQDLIAPWPASLEPYRPRVRYYLLEAAKYSTAELAPLILRNAVAAVFQLEHDRSPEQVLTVLEALSQWFTSPEQRLLNEELTRWIRNFIIVPQLPNYQLETFTNLQELTTMLATQLGDWTTHWKAQGLAEGRAKGRAEGRAEVLLRLLEEKFGPLATDIQNSLYKLEENTVLEYVKRTLTANSVQEVLGPK